MTLNEEHAEDVAAASAAYAFNVLPAITAADAPDAYRMLCDLFHAAIVAYVEAGNGWQVVPLPSEN